VYLFHYETVFTIVVTAWASFTCVRQLMLLREEATGAPRDGAQGEGA
jgi:hypothetical protein